MTNFHPWRQVAPKRWERRLGAMEKFYTLFSVPPGQPLHLNIFTAIKFKYTGPSIDMEEALRAAWIKMRHLFPTIASRVASDNTGQQTMVYESPSLAELEAWLEESFQVHDATTAAEIASNLVSRSCITLHYCPSSSELLLQAEHTYMDGRGMLYFFDSFFEALAHPEQSKPFGDEVKNLPLALDDLIGWSECPSEEDRQLGLIMAGEYANPNPICLPVADIHQPPGNNLRCTITLDEATTAAVIHRCKELRITVTPAWHAAIAFATRDLQAQATTDKSKGITLNSYTNFDMRPRAVEPGFAPRACAVSGYHAGHLAHVTPGDRDLLSIATELHTFYKEIFAKGSKRLAALPALGEVVGPAFAAGPPPSSAPVLSSMGVLKRFINNSFGSQRQWDIEDICVGDFMLSAEVESFLWTWKDRMILSGCANAAFYKEEEIQQFLCSVRDVMLEGLGVDV